MRSNTNGHSMLFDLSYSTKPCSNSDLSLRNLSIIQGDEQRSLAPLEGKIEER